MRHPDDELTHEQIAELGALLVAERPRPSERFAATLDARVAARFAGPRLVRARTPSTAPGARLRAALRWPRLPAAASALAVALVALVVALNVDGGGPGSQPVPATSSDGGAAANGPATATDLAARSHAARPTRQDAAPLAGQRAAQFGAIGDEAARKSPATDFQHVAPEALALLPGARKVEQSSTLTLGAPADRVDDVAQAVLSVVAHAGGIVDQSSVSASGERDASARFALRIPAARLQPTLAELSQLPNAHVLARSDDALDVNQAYVSLRRRLANASAERAGLLRALRAATSEDETLRLRARLDAVERTIAATERAQRGLNRRIDWSRVELTVASEQGTGGGGGAFTPRRALHDAGRLLAVTAGVVVIAAAALLPLAVVLALGWPLARALRRRRREQALDAV